MSTLQHAQPYAVLAAILAAFVILPLVFAMVVMHLVLEDGRVREECSPKAPSRRSHHHYWWESPVRSEPRWRPIRYFPSKRATPRITQDRGNGMRPNGHSGKILDPS